MKYIFNTWLGWHRCTLAAHHKAVISYEDAWKLIGKDKYVEVMLAVAE